MLVVLLVVCFENGILPLTRVFLVELNGQQQITTPIIDILSMSKS